MRKSFILAMAAMMAMTGTVLFTSCSDDDTNTYTYIFGNGSTGEDPNASKVLTLNITADGANTEVVKTDLTDGGSSNAKQAPRRVTAITTNPSQTQESTINSLTIGVFGADGNVNVIKEVRNFIEMAGLIDDYQLNPKVFQCNLDALIAICLDFKSGNEGNLCGKILEKLRDSKDGKVAHAVKRQEQPVQTFLKEAVVKSVQGGIELIPGVGKACGELFAKLFEN